MDDVLSESARYLLEQVRPSRLTTIADVGANPINPVPYAALLASKRCRIVGFEPQKDAFAKLKQRESATESYFNHAVGDGGPLKLHLARSGSMTSIFPSYVPSLKLIGLSRLAKLIGEVTLDSVALDELPDLPVIDALKIDIQGGELKVIEAAKRVLSQAVCVIIELRYLRLYHGEPMLGGMDCALREQGFELHKFLFNKSLPLANSQSSRLRPRRNGDQLIDGDAVYLRDLTKLAEFSDDQLAHLAILATSTFESHTLAILCLDHLVARGKVAAEAPARYVDLMDEQLKN